jgi:hypothetical protein
MEHWNPSKHTIDNNMDSRKIVTWTWNMDSRKIVTWTWNMNSRKNVTYEGKQKCNWNIEIQKQTLWFAIEKWTMGK